MLPFNDIFPSSTNDLQLTFDLPIEPFALIIASNAHQMVISSKVGTIKPKAFSKVSSSSIISEPRSYR